jgi:hypothetical protein
MIIYKAKNRLYSSWCVGGPPKAVFTTSLDKENFAPLLKQLYSSNKALATLSNT